MKAVINKEILSSILSIGVSASKDKSLAILNTIALTIDKGRLTAYATDRYMVVRGQYDVELEDWIEDEVVLLDPTKLKAVNDMIKARGKYSTDPVEITVEGLHVEIDGITVSPDNIMTKFPSVLKLFPNKEDATGYPTLALNPNFLARLTKVLSPEARPNRERVWEFSFFGGGERKPSPVLATYSGEGYTLDAIIQPALLNR